MSVPKPLTFTPEAEALLRKWKKGKHRLQRRPPSHREMLKLVRKMRELLKRQRADPSLPRSCVNPLTGEVVDLLDGETDRFLDEIEKLALYGLGLHPPSGRA
jgi:hypothetical protein